MFSSRAHGVLIVFDVTSHNALERLKSRIEEARRDAPDGNK